MVDFTDARAIADDAGQLQLQPDRYVQSYHKNENSRKFITNHEIIDKPINDPVEPLTKDQFWLNLSNSHASALTTTLEQ